jgi:glycosyltransferase involved in cell wall biosynthesis
MKIIVATSSPPFVRGGHLIIAKELVNAINEYGHNAELLLTPQNSFGKVYRAYIATRLIDLSEDGIGDRIDKVISFRYPSYALKHNNHTLWLNHRMREYYDLWEQFNNRLSRKGKIKEYIKRKIIFGFDKYFINRVKNIFVQSENIGNRLKKWGNHKNKVLYPPPPKRKYRVDGYSNTIFTVSRLVNHKRVNLLIKALKHIINNNINIRVAGDGPELQNLKNLASRLNLENRVQFLGRISEETLIEEYAKCGAVYYAPYNEDYGFVTVESFSSYKPVISTDDSGGVKEIIEKSGGGIISEPIPEKIAKNIDKIFEKRATLLELGDKGNRWVSQLKWENTVKTLLE